MPLEMTTFGLALDRRSRAPLHQQVFDAMAGAIRAGGLPHGADLPSTRALALSLGVSRNTVSWAYERLVSDRYIVTRQGAPARVTRPVPPPAPAPAALPPVAPPATSLDRAGQLLRGPRSARTPLARPSFQPFVPDPRPFPFVQWQRLVSRRIPASCREDMTQDHPAGLPALRALIAEALRTSRGVHCRPDQVIVTHGGQAARDLVFRLILRPGDRLWMEEPADPAARAAAIAAGAVSVPLPVCPDAGWDLDAPPQPAPQAIHVTPACHQPFCRVMPADQRHRLVDYARRHDAWIVEDDFDTDFQPSLTTLPAIQAIDGGARSFHVGSFSRTMFPGLQIGYAVVPPVFAAAAVDALCVAGHSASLPMQGALHDFIAQGHFARHVARMRRLYAARKAHLLHLVQRDLSNWLIPAPGPVGLALPTRMRDGLDDGAPCAAAQMRGLRIPALSGYFHHGSARQGMILGFCTMTPEEMAANVAILRACLMGTDARGG
ncbi:PLP-dependent aminotransferase family protein [Falsirhodobacter halotolerans]|uniref:aminotransferase-like domain-containing protein n=1 Tax=Falsirhodobacter halotolerans TaxID=1146892 RepID=UPI001FD12081|nr:PLP-dependent aminotransferase family protein [Falsirhodobacter halotolerans]MCJ8141237.1 PLP-dependent aminotransferase family protein [Falsirhodobacter halotolerans]